MKKIFLGSDHGGFELKRKILEYLLSGGYEVEDVGCESDESCDYPVFGVAVGEKVVANEGSFGVVVCGSGIGISIAANKVSGVRCALANSKELASLGREHNGANVLALGERTKFIDDPLEILDVFLKTQMDMSDRHVRRRNMLDNLF